MIILGPEEASWDIPGQEGKIMDQVTVEARSRRKNHFTGLAIVTVTYNSAEVLPDFLNSLLADKSLPQARVYLVDNCSTDQTIRIAREFLPSLNLTVISNSSNIGFAGGSNQGIARALAENAEWILLVNNDTIIPPKTLGGLVETATTNNLYILSPTIEGTDPANTVWYSGGSISPFQGMKTRHGNMGSAMSAAPSGLHQTEYAPACCLLVHQSVFRRIGALDNDYFVYFEDADFSLRAQAAGFQYWVSGDHNIIHKASSLTGGYLSSFTVHWMTKNWVIIARKRCTQIQRVSAYAYMQLWMFARVALRKDTWSRFVQRQEAFVEGLRAPLTPHGSYIDFQ